MIGTAGNDQIAGGNGNDVIIGGDGDDTLSGGDGDDSLDAGGGNDSLSGEAGTDRLAAGSGDDTIFDLETGTRTGAIDGGQGFDTFTAVMTGSNAVWSSAGLTVDGTLVWTGLESGVLRADDNANRIDIGGFTGTNLSVFGNGGNDTLIGGAGADVLDGGEGNDTISGLGGNDTLTGGTGNDTILGGDGNDFLNGVIGNDILDGGTGDDSLFMENGDSTLRGGAGDDILFGGLGFDRLEGGAGNDIIRGEGGDDTLLGGDGDDQLLDGDYLSGTRDTFDGGAGNDTFDANTAGQSVVLTNSTLTTAGEVIWRNHRLETGYLRGDDGVNVIDTTGWTRGRLFVFGNRGNDQFRGGSADEVFYGDDGNDTVNAGAGNDFLDGGLGNDKLFGESGNDTVAGQDGNDLLDGGDGNDQIIDAVLFGQNETNILRGGDGDDLLFSGVSNDTLDGGNGNDTLEGGTGADTLLGGAGDDILQTDPLDYTLDVYSGGAGIDTFRAYLPGGTIVLDNTNLTVDGVRQWSNHGLERGQIIGDNGNNTIDVTAFTRGTVDLEGANGDDVLKVGAAGGSISGGGGFNTAWVVGTAGADRFVVGSTTVTLNGKIIAYSTVDRLVIDALGGVDSGVFSSTPSVQFQAFNLEPTVSTGGDETLPNRTLTRTVGFTDIGAVGGWNATVDYGDGSGTQIVFINPDGTITLNHTYTKKGKFAVTVRVIDAEGNVGLSTFRVTAV